jgi:hypothetical protein
VFETALRRLETLHQELSAGLAANPPGSVADVVRVFYAGDMPVSHVLRDLLTLSWWWSTHDEQRVLEAFAPREEALRNALVAMGAEADANRVQALLSVYFAALRRVLVNKESGEAGLARILDRIALVRL